jgi:uncharacterized protein (DUF2141 family)
MLNIDFTKKMKKNEAGFTFVELLIASAMSIIVLGLLAHVFRSQQKEFGANNELNTMQANARGATEFITRSVQNAGFNVKRGTRFLSATDHSLTAVYDEDGDGVIQNDEVITYYLANSWNNVPTESNKFTAWFDANGDGEIDSTEDHVMDVGMTVTGPPFNLYKVTPNADGTDVERSLVARNIDNMVIKYYDKQGRLLPWRTDPNDTDADTTDDVFFNNVTTDSPDLPDGGDWTFNMPVGELNNIRKVEVELIGRSRNKSPKESVSAGSYLPGSLAAVKSGSVNYNDKYYRDEFTGRMAPRNLTMSPWGNIDIVATPPTVNCEDPLVPGSVKATLLDKNGDPVTLTDLAFTSTGLGVTLGSPTAQTDTDGERTTTVGFNFSTPYITTTVSASAQVDDGSGNLRPVYNAVPVGFNYGGTNFNDPFDGSQTEPWAKLDGAALDFVSSGGYFATTTALSTHGAVNGCLAWQDYIVQTNLKQKAGTTWINGSYMGLVFRHTDSGNYYWVILQNISGDGPGSRVLRLTRTVGGVTVAPFGTSTMATIPEGVGSLDPPAQFTEDIPYTLKVQVSGTDIRVKLWKPTDPANPNASEPVAWELGGSVTPITDTFLNNGNVGVRATDNIFQFDDLQVVNPDPIT